MSEIDQYKYTCLGVIECPIPFYAPKVKYVAIYHLEQDVGKRQYTFQGNEGDIIVGGGAGEAAAMRIRIPEAFILYTDFKVVVEDEEIYRKLENQALDKSAFKAYWTPTEAYKFGTGYRKIGWDGEGAIDNWLTYHVLGFLLKNHPKRFDFPEKFRIKEGTLKPLEDGSICRLLTKDEDKLLNSRKYRT